jgi:hypothetical protein
VFRLNNDLSDSEIQVLEREFPELRTSGTRIERTPPFPEEHDEPDLMHLPRITIHFNRNHYGLLIAFIGRINTF